MKMQNQMMTDPSAFSFGNSSVMDISPNTADVAAGAVTPDVDPGGSGGMFSGDNIIKGLGLGLAGISDYLNREFKKDSANVNIADRNNKIRVDKKRGISMNPFGSGESTTRELPKL